VGQATQESRQGQYYSPHERSDPQAAIRISKAKVGRAQKEDEDCLIHAGCVAVRQLEGSKLEVDCYSGRKADERPVRFRLAEHEYLVEEVLDQWYGPHDAFYKVRADDGNLYILRRETSTPDGAWHLVSFRQLP
jgi:hypothetical protein